MRKFKELGKKVKCTGYYKKVKDGVFIACFDDRGFTLDARSHVIEKAVAVNSKKEAVALDFCGDGVDKTLYQLVEKDFEGVCVGKVTLPITEYLYTDFYYNHVGAEVKFIGKQITKTENCYVIYYANNRKRYVPSYCCTFIEED